MVPGQNNADEWSRPALLAHASNRPSGPCCLPLSLKAKIHHPQQEALEALVESPAALLESIPINCAFLPLVPPNKQLLLQGQKLSADLATDGLAFSDGA